MSNRLAAEVSIFVKCRATAPDGHANHCDGPGVTWCGGWNKPFEITSVCRADLQRFFSEAEIAKLDDDHIASITGKMADAYCDQVFWIDAEILAGHVLEDL
jgi:hypothetical protein